MADFKTADIKYEDPGHIRIKPDPETEADSPMLYAEDPEDAGDLEFYDPNLPGDPQGTMYLARLPPYLWQAWNQIAHLDDDAEIELGKVRQWQEADGQVRKPAFRVCRLVTDTDKKPCSTLAPSATEAPIRPRSASDLAKGVQFEDSGCRCAQHLHLFRT